MNISDRVARNFAAKEFRWLLPDSVIQKGIEKSKKLSGVDPNLAKFLVESGLNDGDPSDDKISVSKANISASKLKPSQTTIRLDQVIGMALLMLQTGKIGGDLGALISGDNHILDGHHRWAASILAGGSSPKVGGYQAKLAGKELIKVLNLMTSGEYGRQRGNAGSGNIADITSGNVRKELEDYTTNGISGEFPRSAESVRGILEKAFGSVEEGIDELSKNAKRVSKNVPSWAPNRSDMPVIKPKETPGAAALLNQGKVNWKYPFVVEQQVPHVMQENMLDKDLKQRIPPMMAKVANNFMTNKLVTADDMEAYCADCADKIRRGEFEMTWGELREMIE